MKAGSKPETYYLPLCLKMVEEKLGWGSSDQWSHADFLEISEKISSETRVNLSVTTIKRVWGKVTYAGSPSVTTLNALANFLGYENWRSFKLDQDEKVVEKPALIEQTIELEKQDAPPIEEKILSRIRNRRFWVPVMVALLFSSMAIVLYSAKDKETAPLVADNILFSSEPVAKGIPTTVVFNYDLSAIDFDSAFIQQNWDVRRRERISRENTQHTSVYYFPGHFNAKLVINDQVVKEHGLLIPTEGWLGIVEREGHKVPLYIAPEKMMETGALHVSSQVLESQKMDSGEEYAMNYTNARDFGLDGDNFILEAAVKNDLEAGGKVCQEMMIFIDGETGVMWFPLSAPGCVGNLSLNFGEVNVNGKNQDLSSFGADLSLWNKIRLSVIDRQVEVFLNEEPIYAVSYRKPLGRVMGINFKFHGAGAVDEVRLLNREQEVVFEDAFDLKPEL